MEQTAGAQVFSVGEFAARLREVFRRVRAFEAIGISGEISQWNARQNGVYFTIKDANAVLECFAYHNRAARFPRVAVGTAVVAYGSIRVVERRSRYELLVDDLTLTGIGELYARYEALKERFRAEGLFDASRKRSIPGFPRRVILVSARGKGAEDFQRVMRDRAPNVDVLFVETRVQGIGADVEVAQALDRANALGGDVVVLARGGGSYEDLFTFNCEPVVRAIVRAAVPVITGIGHTGDHHLADDVADLWCETPSNAAQYLASLWHRGEERLARLRAQLDREMRDVLARASQRGDAAHDLLERAAGRTISARIERVRALAARIDRKNPVQGVAALLRRASTLDERLSSKWHAYLSARQNRVNVVTARLDGADPARPLEKGYAMVLRNGALVRSASSLAAGDRISVRLQRGGVDALVETVRGDE